MQWRAIKLGIMWLSFYHLHLLFSWLTLLLRGGWFSHVVPRVPPTVTPTLLFSEVALDIKSKKLDSGGVAVGGAPGTCGLCKLSQLNFRAWKCGNRCDTTDLSITTIGFLLSSPWRVARERLETSHQPSVFCNRNLYNLFTKVNIKYRTSQQLKTCTRRHQKRS